MELSSEIIRLIKKETKGKINIKLNIGFLIGEKTVFKTFGESGEINFENNLYEIGSMTKTFTASLLAKHISQNEMRLDDRISNYIKDLDPNKYYPSLQRIATHTAGYSATFPLSSWEYLGLVKDTIFGKGKTKKENPFNMEMDEMFRLIEKSKLKDKDYKWSYSNFGIALLGYAVGLVSGNGYWDSMKKFIANELKLENTYLGTENSKIINGFNSKNENCGNWKWNKNGLTVSFGGLCSTVEDLLAYARVNMYEEKNYLTICHKKYANATKKHDMGLVWWLDKENNNIIMHQGGTGCFSSFLCIDKGNKKAVVILSNYSLPFSIAGMGKYLLKEI